MSTQMIHKILFFLLVCCCVPVGGDLWGSTYRWTDDKGNICFSDNLASIPKKQRNRAIVADDITINNPEVKESVEEGRQQAANIAREDQKRSWELTRKEKEYLSRAKQENSRKQATKAQEDAAQKPTKVPLRRRLS